MCRTVWASNKVPSLHFYCLNSHAPVFQILANLGVEIDTLESPKGLEEVARVHGLVKTMCAPKAPREETTESNGEGATKKAKTSEPNN